MQKLTKLSQVLITIIAIVDTKITEITFKLYWTKNSTVLEGDCKVSKRISSQ